MGIAEFYLYMGFGADLLNKTAEIGIRTPLKSANYFQFVWQATDDEATTFLRRVKKLVKIDKELWT